MHTIYIIFHSCGFYSVARVLITDARSFQSLTTILDQPWCLAGVDPTADKMKLDYLNLLYCEFQKYEVMTMSVVGGRKHANTSCKGKKNMERTFLISYYYWLL